MDAGQVRPARHPLLALGMVPQRADHLPALSVVGRLEQAARKRSTPEDARLVATAGRERPDAGRAPGERSAPHVLLLVALRLRRICGSSNLLPARRRRAVELDAEMTVVERSVVAS